MSDPHTAREIDRLENRLDRLEHELLELAEVSEVALLLLSQGAGGLNLIAARQRVNGLIVELRGTQR
jgi:hypothetical protein